MTSRMKRVRDSNSQPPEPQLTVPQLKAPRPAVPQMRMSELVELPWHKEAETLMLLGKPPLVLFVGDPGVGKTTKSQQMARATTGFDPLVLSGSPEVEHSHLFGRWTLAGSETLFVDGPLPQALKTGRWLLIEEFSQIPLECRAALLPLRDQAVITNPMNGEVVPIPESFRLVATSNSETLTCRKNSGIAKVLFDGFLVLECGELSDIQVSALLERHFPTTTDERRKRVLALWNEYREFTSKGSSGKAHLSYRAADHLIRLLEAGLPEHRAVQIALVNKFLPSDADLFQAASLKNSLQV
jgi:hypothetical protein